MELKTKISTDTFTCFIWSQYHFGVSVILHNRKLKIMIRVTLVLTTFSRWQECGTCDLTQLRGGCSLCFQHLPIKYV